MLFLDTSALVAAFCGSRPLLNELERRVGEAEILLLGTPVLYEWLRGPRTPGQHASREMFFPDDEIIEFSVEAARISADLYRAVPRARRRQTDLAIAAMAIERAAGLWTANPADFSDIAGLELIEL